MIQFSEEQKALREMVGGFITKEVAPYVAEWDEKGIFSRDTFKKLAQLGLTGILTPEKYGGAGLDYVTYAMILEEMGKKAGGGAIGGYLCLHLSIQNPLCQFGTSEQKERYLLPLAKGRYLGAFALTEPGGGSDIGALQTTAQKEKVSNEYRLNGIKRFISSAGEADIYLVMAKTNRDRGKEGISAFLVEKGRQGLSFGKKEDKIAAGYQVTGDLIFEDCPIPEENRLGKEGEGFQVAMSSVVEARVGVAAGAIGLSQAALDIAIAYSRERIAFGAPISTFQGIQFMMADMAMGIEASRLLTYNAAFLKDQGLPAITAASMAKCFATDTAMRVTTDAVQILGGYGCIKEYKVERLMREAKILQIIEGTNQIQRLIIARDLLKR